MNIKMNKRVATLTFHWAINYGAVIQAYALQKFLLEKGFETEIIDYRPRRMRLVGLYNALRKKDINSLVKQFRLEKFRRKYLILSKKRYGTNKELREIPPYYAVIVGSDQVWNTHFTLSGEKKTTLSYFLDFVSGDTKRISYAASFGCVDVPENYVKAVGPLLSCFDAISVRESTGVEILRKMGNYGKLVCDPTVLLERREYETLFKPNNDKEEYCFCYMLHGRKCDAVQHLTEVNSVLGIERVIHSKSERLIKWLAYIHGASFVISNSFHCIMFSLIFNRPFIALSVPGSQMNSRMETILSQVGLTERFITAGNRETVESIIIHEIDWQRVNELLSRIRQKGEDFIISSLRECVVDNGD